MRSLTPTEQKTDQIRSLTVLGLLADDLALAALRYPDLSEAESRAVAWFAQSIEQAEDRSEQRVALPRTRSMTDHTAVLYQAAEAVHLGPASTAGTVPPDLGFMSECLASVEHHTASEEELEITRAFADVLSTVTLDLAERLSHEKGTPRWTPSALTYSSTSLMDSSLA
ncbi:MAG: hypothetical protein GY788_22955 [bacterium]|nr:hypothetical protein [bacterium]